MIKTNSANAVSLIIVDDDFDLRDSLSDYFGQCGMQVSSFASGQTMLEQLSTPFAGVIVCDLQMPGMSGLAVLEALSQQDNPPPFILMTAYGDIPTAVQAMQLGAYDFLEKPFDPARLLEKVERAAQSRDLQLKNTRLRQQIGQLLELDQHLIGQSSAMQAIREQVIDYSQTDSPILIMGETGVGKSLLATLIHLNSPRAEQTLITSNCAITMASQFDPHAAAEHNLLHMAHHSTLVLDDLPELSPNCQNQLVSVMSESEHMLIPQPDARNVRFISTAPAKFSVDDDNNQLRKDLYFRLNALVIQVPPLRERPDDIPELFNAFCHRYASQYQHREIRLSNDDILSLNTHSWPGNVRELKHCAERFVLANQRSETTLKTIIAAKPDALANKPRNLRQHVEKFEKTLIKQALIEHEGNINNVCESLNIPRRTLNEKLLKYDLNRLNFIP